MYIPKFGLYPVMCGHFVHEIVVVTTAEHVRMEQPVHFVSYAGLGCQKRRDKAQPFGHLVTTERIAYCDFRSRYGKIRLVELAGKCFFFFCRQHGEKIFSQVGIAGQAFVGTFASLRHFEPSLVDGLVKEVFA